MSNFDNKTQAAELEALSGYYCICSDATYQDILERQKADPLKFTDFLEKHTSCTEGCGSCIDNLQDYLSQTGYFIE